MQYVTISLAEFTPTTNAAIAPEVCQQLTHQINFHHAQEVDYSFLLSGTKP